MDDSAEKKALKDAEDEISRLIEPLTDGKKAILYKTLYNLGWRIDRVDQAIRREFRP